MEGENSAYIQLSGRQKTCLQLGRELQSLFRVQNHIQVKAHGDGWYSATFSSKEDYDQAFKTRKWRIPGCNSIYYCRWQPNFGFKKLRPLISGDVVEGSIKFLPLEYYRDDLVLEIANAVCLPLGCPLLMVDGSSLGKLPRFLFVYNGSQLPLNIRMDDGKTVVELSYSQAQMCSICRGYGHIGSSCTTRFSYSSGSTLDHPHHPQSGSAPIADPLMPSLRHDIQAAFQAGPHQATPPIPVLNDIPRSSEITSPKRSVVEKTMPCEGAMIVEKGEERRSILYTLEENVSEIHVSVEVKHLKDKDGNLRKITINPHTGDAPNYIKRVLCTSIDGADATRTLEEMCHGKGASLVVVLDKSSVLVNDDQMHTKLGFSASHRVGMIFQRAGENGSVPYVKGNCLLMWKAEEVRVSVDTELSLSEHLKFNASWIIGGVTTPPVEDLGNYSNSSDGSYLGGPSSSYPAAPEELSTESANVLLVDTPGGDAPTFDYGDIFPREEHPYQDSTPSSPRSEYSYSGPPVYDESPHHSHDINILSTDHGDTDAEGSSDESFPGSPGSNISYLGHGNIDADGSSADEWDPLPELGEDFNNEAEEISCGSSACSARSSSSSSS